MATKAQQVKVGIFLTLGLALLIGIAILIRINKRRPSDTYFIKFRESVGGLSKDSPVLYRGVPVGKVEDISVSDNNEIIVQIGIDRERVTLRKGIIATLDLGNLMGGMVIDLSGGEATAASLAPGSYIPSKSSILENITQELPRILSDIRSILDKLNRSIGDVSQARLGNLSRKAEQVLKTAHQTLRQADTLMESTRNTISNSEIELAHTLRDLRMALQEAQQTLHRVDSDPSSLIWGSHPPPHPYVK